MRVFAPLILATTTLCACCYAAFGQQSNSAEITLVNGSVEVRLEGTDSYVPAEEGMELEAGDLLRTAGGASCELSFNQANSNIVRVSENTQLTVVLSGDEKLEMGDGEVFASISELPGGSAFEIRTPTAVSGARGTDWVTKVAGEETEVEAIESTPFVRHFESSGTPSRQETMIYPGQMTSVKRFQPPQAARPIASNRMQKWQGAKHDMRQNGQRALINKANRPAFNRGEFKNKVQQLRSSGAKPQQMQQLKPQEKQQQIKQQQQQQQPKVQKPVKNPPPAIRSGGVKK